MTEWSSINAIERDLALVQGRVPVSISRTLIVGSDDRPPVPQYVEETEEEFFENCISDADFSKGPDLGFIKEMLNMVREPQASDRENYVENAEENNTVILEKEEVKPQLKPLAIKKKRPGRNAALTSLLEAIGEPKPDPVVARIAPNLNKATVSNNTGSTFGVQGITKANFEVHTVANEENCAHGNEYSEENSNGVMNLMKPDAFISSKADLVVVNDIISGKLPENIDKGLLRKKNVEPSNPLLRMPSNMFRKKSPLPKISNPNTPSPQSPAKGDYKAYKPTPLANEYYQKFLERTKLIEETTDDIWTRAEKQMKEIDARVKLQLEEPRTSFKSHMGEKSSLTTVQKEETFGTHEYRLPFHRHVLEDDCLVCELMEKHKYDVESMKKCPQLLDPPLFLNEQMDTDELRLKDKLKLSEELQLSEELELSEVLNLSEELELSKVLKLSEELQLSEGLKLQ